MSGCDGAVSGISGGETGSGMGSDMAGFLA
jgi:hypothetical protein